jgi:hypothetical protein
MKEHTITLNVNDSPIEAFQKVYEHFLSFEGCTSMKGLWNEQKKIYEEILNAKDPLRSYETFKALNKTTLMLALERLGANDPH